jgi:hypothetical protein
VFHKGKQHLFKQKFHPTLDNSQINKIIQTKNDTWVASSKGLFEIRVDRVIHYETVDGLLSNDIRDICID